MSSVNWFELALLPPNHFYDMTDGVTPFPALLRTAHVSHCKRCLHGVYESVIKFPETIDQDHQVCPVRKLSLMHRGTIFPFVRTWQLEAEIYHLPKARRSLLLSWIHGSARTVAGPIR